MRIAVLSDIHSNLPALEAVLALARSADTILCCGDIVGYFADPNEVCGCLQAFQVPCIRGNHDAYVTGELAPSPRVRNIARVDWTRRELSKPNLRWLRSLPTEIRTEVGSLAITMRHASPWDEETYLYADSLRIGEIQLRDNEMLFLGHTHHQFARKAGRGLIVNPGSVGQPRDTRGGACLSFVVETEPRVQAVRTTYDTASYQKRLVTAGWDPAVVHSIDQGGS